MATTTDTNLDLALATYAETISKYGVESAESQRVFERHADDDEFRAVAAQLRERGLELHQRYGDPNAAASSSPRRLLWLMGALVAALVLALGVSLWRTERLHAEVERLRGALQKYMAVQHIVDAHAEAGTRAPDAGSEDFRPIVGRESRELLDTIGPSATIVEQTAEGLYLLAKQAYADGELDRSRELVDRILAHEDGREWSRAHYFNAILLQYHEGDLDAAADEYRRAMQLADAGETAEAHATFVDAANNLAWLELGRAMTSEPHDPVGLASAHGNATAAVDHAEAKQVPLPNRVLDTRAQIEEAIGDCLANGPHEALEKTGFETAEDAWNAARATFVEAGRAAELGEERRRQFESRSERVEGKLAALEG